MKLVSPHRKRRANKGRIDTGVVVTSGYRCVDGELTWNSDIAKDSQAAERHREVDALIDEVTFHRNRFNADHRVVMRVQNTRWSQELLRKVSEMGDIEVTREFGGILYAKVTTNAVAILAVIQASRLAGMFEMVEGFCGENKTPMASTMRRLHGRSY